MPSQEEEKVAAGAIEDEGPRGIQLSDAVTSARHIPPLHIVHIVTSYLYSTDPAVIRACLVCADCGLVWWAAEGGFTGGGGVVATTQLPYANSATWTMLRWFCSEHVTADCVFLANTPLTPFTCVMSE